MLRETGRMTPDDELRRLRERVYGTGGHASDAEIARLHELEAAFRGHPGELSDAASVSADPESSPTTRAVRDEHAPDTSGSEPTPPASAEHSAHRSRWRTAVSATVAAAVVGGAAFAAGLVVATPAAPDDFSELLLPQTEEDVITAAPEDSVADSIDLSSTRFIARLNGYDVFLARPADVPGVCVFVRVAGSDVLSGAGCSENPTGRGSVGFSGVGGLTVYVGDVQGTTVGDPVRLSENVVAYVA
jgi:hypothetical protein